MFWGYEGAPAIRAGIGLFWGYEGAPAIRAGNLYNGARGATEVPLQPPLQAPPTGIIYVAIIPLKLSKSTLRNPSFNLESLW